MSQFEIIGTPATRGFKRYVMPFSASSAPRTTLSNVEGEWVVRNLQIYTCGTTCCQKNAPSSITSPILLMEILPNLALRITGRG